MFFQWRASQAGSEKFHSAMVPHVGTESRTWREVVALGQELRRLDAVLPTRVRAEVAMVWDWESWWVLELDGKPSRDINLIEQISAYYQPLFARNITVDIVSPDAEVSDYRLVLVPNFVPCPRRIGTAIGALRRQRWHGDDVVFQRNRQRTRPYLAWRLPCTVSEHARLVD